MNSFRYSYIVLTMTDHWPPQSQMCIVSGPARCVGERNPKYLYIFVYYVCVYVNKNKKTIKTWIIKYNKLSYNYKTINNLKI